MYPGRRPRIFNRRPFLNRHDNNKWREQAPGQWHYYITATSFRIYGHDCVSTHGRPRPALASRSFHGKRTHENVHLLPPSAGSRHVTFGTRTFTPPLMSYYFPLLYHWLETVQVNRENDLIWLIAGLLGAGENKPWPEDRMPSCPAVS
jgi:hypothetical protein